MPITWEEDTFGMKFVLFWLLTEDLTETGETSSGLNLGCVVPKPLLDRVGQGCGIISN
jgi:hypothetical protein